MTTHRNWWQEVCRYGHFDCSYTTDGPCGDEHNPPEAHCPTCGVDLAREGYPLAHQNDEGELCGWVAS